MTKAGFERWSLCAAASFAPVLDIPRNQFRTDRIPLGSGRLDLFADAEGLRASLDVDMAKGTAVRGEATARRGRGVPVSTYPLVGLLRVESQDLTGLAVLVPEIDRSGGRLDGSVTIAGTLGEPRFDGEFHVPDGRVDMYRSNLSLTGVNLDGRFVGDELVFDGRGVTKRGELAFDGRFAWPGGVMTGAMHLKGEQLTLSDTPEYKIVASPDLLLRAGADGYEVTVDVSGNDFLGPRREERQHNPASTPKNQRSPDPSLIAKVVHHQSNAPPEKPIDERVRVRICRERGLVKPTVFSGVEVISIARLYLAL